MDTKKIKKYSPLLIVIGTLLLLLVLLLASHSYSTLVLDSSSRYFRARTIFLFRNSMVCLKNDTYHDTRAKALGADDERTSFAILSLDEISLIEILPDEEEKPDEGDLPIRHYGKYRINASGHNGYLYLSRKGNTVYGTIRFPEWGYGSYEKLKDIRVGKNTIQFTRSVTTVQEMRKTGAPTYFTQKYQGTYTIGGKFIKGQYKTSQGKFLWEAVRMK
ncbi:MAG TPA: hypothetical protein PK926_17130 [Spirochaetota bacterium]|nr:hypothetical protein [Spirochaetota bacterium]HPI90830.1 hypothetical protein [Spirochaetota bacterium]HPR47625.1 hypothetical protein [Spirochaetota bacterium]